MSGDHRWFRVLPGALVCALLWGSAFPAIKTVYGMWNEAGHELGFGVYWWFAGVRFTLAGAVLLLVARQPVREFRQTSKVGLGVLALTQTFFQYFLFYLAVSVASGSLTGLLTSCGSFWWVILAPLLAAQPWPNRRQWFAIVLGACGIVLAMAAPGAGAGKPVLGTVLVLGASAAGAVGVIQYGKLKSTIGARAATGYALGAGGVMLLMCGFSTFPRAAELMTPQVMLLTGWLIFVSAAAFSLWNYLSTKHPVPLLAGYRFLIPICGMTESLIFLENESAGWGLLVGAAIVVLSLILMQRASVPNGASPEARLR